MCNKKTVTYNILNYESTNCTLNYKVWEIQQISRQRRKFEWKLTNWLKRQYMERPLREKKSWIVPNNILGQKGGVKYNQSKICSLLMWSACHKKSYLTNLEVWNLKSAVSALCGCLSFACFEKKWGKVSWILQNSSIRHITNTFSYDMPTTQVFNSENAKNFPCN